MSKRFTLHKIAFVAILAALVYVVTFFRFPLLGSKVHFANAICLVSGLLMGPLAGGLAAGLGSMLYDVFFYPSDLLGYAVTFVTKFAMAWVCGKIAFAANKEARSHGWNIVACVVEEGGLVQGHIQVFRQGADAPVYELETAALWKEVGP